MITCTLSIPPSANRIWRHRSWGSNGSVTIYKTPEAKEWQEEAAWELKISARWVKTPLKKAAVKAEVFYADQRRRDIDNMAKLLGDAIRDAGIVEDDKDIYYWQIERKQTEKKARMEVRIWEHRG